MAFVFKKGASRLVKAASSPQARGLGKKLDKVAGVSGGVGFLWETAQYQQSAQGDPWKTIDGAYTSLFNLALGAFAPLWARAAVVTWRLGRTPDTHARPAKLKSEALGTLSPVNVQAFVEMVDACPDQYKEVARQMVERARACGNTHVQSAMQAMMVLQHEETHQPLHRKVARQGDPFSGV